MKRWLFVFMVVALSLLAVSPALAHEDMGCAHDETTIASLRECVVHAREMGHIDSDRVAQNLLKKLDKAQASLDSGKVTTRSTNWKTLSRRLKSNRASTSIRCMPSIWFTTRTW